MMRAMRRGTRLAVAFTVIVPTVCVFASGARAQYGDLEEAARILPRLLRWAEPTGRTTVFDRACRAIPVKRYRRELTGEAPGGKDGNWYGLSFSVQVQLTGPNWQSKDGKFATALGQLQLVETALSRVTRDAAWYGAEHPLIFRSRAACRDYRRKHQVAEIDLLIWPAFFLPR